MIGNFYQLEEEKPMTNKEIIQEQLRLKLISWVSKLIIEWTSRSIEKDRSDLIKDLSNKIDKFYEKALSKQRKKIVEKIIIRLRENCLEYNGNWNMHDKKGKGFYCKKFTMRELIKIIKDE